MGGWLVGQRAEKKEVPSGQSTVVSWAEQSVELMAE
jgi:hypothetical protein